ncbi:MAG: Gfo/Idh/MocA family oxidoreductase [Proteiniphilum sp.]
MVHWGFIGCGSVTEKKSGPAFSKVEGSDVVAVMRRNIDKAKDYAERHGIGKWYDNAQDLINDPQVNAVYVATPPASHAEYAIAAMRAGKPVYVEKPMAASYAECLQINRVSEETGIPCFVAYYRRTLPYFRRVKQLIDDGVPGTVSTVQIRFAIPPYPADYDRNNLPWRVKKEIAGGGYFYDLASHQLDLLDYLFGPVTDVHGFAANVGGLYDVEDTLTAAFRFQSGVLGSGSWSFVAHKESRTDQIDFVGTKGKLTCSTFDFTPIVLETEEGKQEFREENPENIQFYLIQSIVDFLNGKGEIPVSTGTTAIRTNLIMDRIMKKI